MFPLLKTGEDNPLELFQIWLNLPRRSKMAEPHFTMFWNEQVPRRVLRTRRAARPRSRWSPGASATWRRSPPPPDSWAAEPESDVAIWTCAWSRARLQLPPRAGAARAHALLLQGRRRMVGGQACRAGGDLAASRRRRGRQPATRSRIPAAAGPPIAEPVAQYGPFVMNTQQEIMQAMQDYRRTQFGGWSFGDSAPVHGGEPARFARYPERGGDRKTPNFLGISAYWGRGAAAATFCCSTTGGFMQTRDSQPRAPSRALVLVAACSSALPRSTPPRRRRGRAAGVARPPPGRPNRYGC
jgi:hypothetical protein